MNAPDLAFLGPARQARAGSASETRLADEGGASREAEDFATAMGSAEAPVGPPRKPRAAEASTGAAAGTAPAGADPAAETARGAIAAPANGMEEVNPPPAPTRDGTPPATEEAPTDAASSDTPAELARESVPVDGMPAGMASPRRDPSNPVGAASTPAQAVLAAAGSKPVPPAGAGEATPAPAPDTAGAGDAAQVAAVAVRPSPESIRTAGAAVAALARTAPGGAEAAAPAAPSSAISGDKPAAEGPAAGLTAVLPANAITNAADTKPDAAAFGAAGADALPGATGSVPAPEATTSGQTTAPFSILPGPIAGQDAATRLGQPGSPEAGQPRAVVEQIAVAVAESDDSRVEIRLDPAELGRVHISLTRTEQGVHALVTAERPETMELLRRHAETLTRELGAAGYDSVSLDMSQGSRHFAGDTPPERPARIYAVARGVEGAASPDAALVADTTRARGRAAGADGPLDIRL